MMSSASKSMSKDKKAVKESQKASTKPSGPANAGSGVPASAYNPLLGTFHTIETVPSSSASSFQNNGRFQNIDETDEHLGSSHGAGVEYDSVSNNGSWSGESEDHKEKTSNLPAPQETIPGADNDKREKNRQKNERKHQRQKERRAQELHERCRGYLMSRKLEALAQQLVAMGFSHDQATMALILNEGKVEESVVWLLEGGEEAVKHKDSTIGGGNLKIDISEELVWIADMEIKYKCTKQEVERAVVGAEGDLEKAAKALQTLKQDPPAPPKPEETCDSVATNTNKVPVASGQSLSVRSQPKPNPSPATQQRRDEKDFNCAKAAVTVGGYSESVSKSFQPLKRIQPKLEWAQSAASAENRWPSSGSNTSVSYSSASSLQALPPPAKTESRFVAVGSDFKNLQPSIREPVIMMQRPQAVNTKQVSATSISSSSPGTISFVYPISSVDNSESNGIMPHMASGRSLSSNLSSNQMHHQLYYPQNQQFKSGNVPGDSPGTSRGNGLWSRTGASPMLAPASSLGLFTGLGCTSSSGASSPVDWSSGSSMEQLDYTNIDWSLDRGLSSQRTDGIWLGSTSPMKNTHMYYPNKYDLSAKPAMRLKPSNWNGVSIAGMQGGGVATAETSTAGSHEWTSPFEGKDLFSLPRQFVSSPSL